MDWWTLLKGRGKIRIPTKRKRLKKNPNRSKATRESGYNRGTTERDKKRDAYVERQNRMAEREDRRARERAFNPLAGINDDRNPMNIGEPIVGNRRDRLVSTKRGPIHQFRRGKPTLTNEDRETNRLAREHPTSLYRDRDFSDFADVMSLDEDDEETRSDADGLMAYLASKLGVDADGLRQAVNAGHIDLEELQQRLLQTPVDRARIETKRMLREADPDDFSYLQPPKNPSTPPIGHAMQALREKAFIPKRQKSVAHDRRGFRTGGGETLPLPDTQKERDERDLREIGEEMARLMERDYPRRIKVNYPRKPSAMMYEPHLAEAEDRRLAAVRAARDRASAKVNSDLREKFQQSDALQNQQYDRAGNRIQGE